jgi:hypothetical protein
MLKTITDERAAQRFRQIVVIERELVLASADLAAGKEHIKELQEVHKGLMRRLRAAARDEGELPLFDLDDDGH